MPSNPRLDRRTAGAGAGVLLPLAVLLFVLLRPWAAGLEPADFPTMEGVAAGPLVAVVLLVVALAYRPFMATSIVDRRGIEEIRLAETPVALAVWFSPLVVGLFGPFFAGGRTVPTVLLGIAVAGGEVLLLESQRRGSADRRVRWTDPALEGYRLRGGIAVLALVVAAGLTSLDFTTDGSSQLGGFLAVLVPLVCVSPYWIVISTLIEDQVLTLKSRLGGGIPAVILLATPLLALVKWGPDSLALLVLLPVVVGCLLLLERARRAAIGAHLARIADAGQGGRVAEAYPRLAQRHLPR